MMTKITESDIELLAIKAGKIGENLSLWPRHSS